MFLSCGLIGYEKLVSVKRSRVCIILYQSWINMLWSLHILEYDEHDVVHLGVWVEMEYNILPDWLPLQFSSLFALVYCMFIYYWFSACF